MKRILRSLLDISDAHGYPTVPVEELKHNLTYLRDSGFQFEHQEDKDILDAIIAHFHEHIECPNINKLRDYLDENQLAGDRLDEIKTQPFYVKTNFIALVKEISIKQREKKSIDILTTAAEIIHAGVEIVDKKNKKILRKGLKDATRYVTSEFDKIASLDIGNVRLRGDIREDYDEVKAEYERKVNDPTYFHGRLCGLSKIDMVTKGVRRGELWIHAGFAGEFKTSFALNWAYNQVTRYHWNVFYETLEMPYEQVRLLIWCLHSANLKFKNAGYEPINYIKLRDGELNPTEKKHFFDVVAKDFDENSEYGSFWVERPSDEITIKQIKEKMEARHIENPINLGIIDHGSLVKPSSHTNNYTVDLNSVVRDAKLMALNFNHGEGLPLLMLFQINRKGKEAADKNEGIYHPQDLSYANEAERSADVITATYLNKELRDNGETIISCLKNRDNKHFDPFNAKINWECRRLYNLDASEMQKQIADMGIDIMKELGG